MQKAPGLQAKEQPPIIGDKDVNLQLKQVLPPVPESQVLLLTRLHQHHKKALQLVQAQTPPRTL